MMDCDISHSCIGTFMNSSIDREDSAKADRWRSEVVHTVMSTLTS